MENPDATGANTSATVAKFTARQAGQPYAGTQTLDKETLLAAVRASAAHGIPTVIHVGRWQDVRDAVYEAGLKRIRPCTMTTITTLVALLPVLFVTVTSTL